MNKHLFMLVFVAISGAIPSGAQPSTGGRSDIGRPNTRAFNQNSSRSNHTRSRGSAIMNVPDDHAFNQNSSNSNHTNSRRMGVREWQFGYAAGASVGMKRNESTLFRGNGFFAGLSSNYFWGRWGLGAQMGFIHSVLDRGAIDRFMVSGQIPQPSTVSTSAAQNTFLLMGPSVRFGNTIQILASVKGGLFLNQGGSVVIGQPGAVRPAYRVDAGNQAIFSGLSNSLSFSYPLSGSTSIQLQADYILSSSSVRIVYPGQGIDQPAQQKRKFQSLNTGLSFVKRFNHSSNESSASGRSQRYRRVRDLDPSTADEVSLFDPVNSRLIKTKTRSNQSNDRVDQHCGPVSVKKQLPDGTMEERSFACLSDLENYEAKENDRSGREAGDKRTPNTYQPDSIVGVGHRIQGRIWRTVGSESITTNLMPTPVARAHKSGVQSSFYVRASTGSAGQKRGNAAEPYRMLYSDQSGMVDSSFGSIQIGSLHTESGDRTDKRSTSGDFDSDGFEDMAEVSLIDRRSGSVIATTRTDSTGAYWFAHVPNGSYDVSVVAAWLSKKGYDFYQSGSDKKMDVAGRIAVPAETWQHLLVVDTSRYIQYLSLRVGDLSGDMCDDLIIGSPNFWYGSSAGSNSPAPEIARPGNPIGGLNIKGGRNPGGNIVARSATNSLGEFEFRDLEQGNYRFFTEIKYLLHDRMGIDLSTKSSKVYSSNQK